MSFMILDVTLWKFPTISVHDFYDARRNVVEIRGNPVHELSNAQT